MLLNNVILPQPANQHCKTTTEIAKMFSPFTNISFKVLAVVSMNAVVLILVDGYQLCGETWLIGTNIIVEYGQWVPTVDRHKHYGGTWLIVTTL